MLGARAREVGGGVPAAPFIQKRIRLSAWVKTEGATKRADFWARVQSPSSRGDGEGLVGQFTKLSETTDWVQQSIVLDVPDDAAVIQYAVGIAGPGRLWVDDAKLEVVSKDVPVTTGYEEEQLEKGWLKTGVGAPDYRLVAEADGVMIERTAEQSRRYVAVVRRVPAASFVGKDVHVSFDLRREGVEEGGCVLKVQPVAQLQYGGFLAGDFKLLTGDSSSFGRCELRAHVPEHAEWILFGFSHHGSGRAWLKNESFGLAESSSGAPPSRDASRSSP